MLLSIYYSLIISTASTQPQVTVQITPQATITQVCLPTSCSSSWAPHENEASATGHEPQKFNIPAEDRK
jgi:hypothetical protein